MTKMIQQAPTDMAVLVNRLAQELAQARRDLAVVTRSLGTSRRSLDGRTQELTEARAALALLLATLESTTEGVMAMGHFGRAMHFNSRFMEIWRISQGKLPTLNDSGLLAIQLSQVKDPARFLARSQEHKEAPDADHFNVVELTDGRILECHVRPQRLRGKRVGLITSFQDVTAAVAQAREITG